MVGGILLHVSGGDTIGPIATLRHPSPCAQGLKYGSRAGIRESTVVGAFSTVPGLFSTVPGLFSTVPGPIYGSGKPRFQGTRGFGGKLPENPTISALTPCYGGEHVSGLVF